MRVFSKILYILFIIAFVVSVGFNIILGVSSSNIKNNVQTRMQLYYDSLGKLSSAEHIRVLDKKPYGSATDGQYTIDDIACSLDKESNKYSCKMISKLFSSDAKLIRTSYFPGDGFKYSLEGETKTKSIYNVDLSTMLTARTSGIGNSYLPLLTYTSQSMEQYGSKYDCNVAFNFNSFSITKEIIYSDKNRDKDSEIKLYFDSNNNITKLVDEKAKSTIEVSYDKTDLSFPQNFNGYALTGEGN